MSLLSNHCLVDNLSCGRGVDYFNGNNNNKEPETLNDLVVSDLRKCGHILHHNKELNTDKLLNSFSLDELE